ncbi:hypothetical protein ACQ4PT_036111 [Festuca glaucescens]
MVLKKWLNRRSKDSKFNAAHDNDDGGEQEENCGCEANGGGAEIADDQEENCGCDGAGAGVEIADESQVDAAPYKLWRRNSETTRAQYINTKELRICICTYNAAGKSPPEGLDIADWLGSGDEQDDMYVLGFQEVVPLNAGIVFGAEDGRPALAWEELIRDTLTRTSTPSRPKYRYRSHPATPTRDGADETFPGGMDTETDDDTPFSFPAQAEEYMYIGHRLRPEEARSRGRYRSRPRRAAARCAAAEDAPEDEEQDGQDRARLAGAAAGPAGHDHSVLRVIIVVQVVKIVQRA